jgi:lauroyl/myristoyl acyltransferase
MSQPNSKCPVRIDHYLVYAVYRSLEFLLKLLPMKLVCLTGAGLGHVAYLVLPGRRHIVTRNLRIAFGEEMSHPEIKKLTLKTFHHTGANLIASIRTAVLSETEILKRVEVVGEENIAAAKKQSHGMIGLLTHMGNWELLGQAHLALPELTPTASLYRPIDNPLIDALIRRRRSNQGAKLFSRRDGFFKPIAHIKEGGSLGILADQQAGAHGIAVPLFGKLTSLTNLPAIIHRRTGASIVPVSISTTTLGKWRFTVHPAIIIPAEKNSDTQHITSLCAEAYETMMRSAPADVFWMHGYWKTGRRGPLKIDGLQKKKARSQEAAASKPFRVIVYTGDATLESTEMIQSIDELKNYRSDIHLTTAGKRRIYPNCDHFMHIEPDVQDTLLVSHLIDHDHSLPEPVDCVLDLTPDSSGACLFQKAGYTHIFAPHGEFQGKRTETYFAKIKNPTLSDFLISLGIED